jgi:uncharacterized protein YeaO (DUF488 family)
MTDATLFDVRLKRAYEPPADTDGVRVLVDRLWPRGLTKAETAIDHWFRDLAPSQELRRWFAHDINRWNEFRRRYADELKDHQAELDELRRLAREQPVTLVFAARDASHNNAVALRDVLLGEPRRSSES